MMKVKGMLLLSGLLSVIAATSASAGVVLSQNFDDTTLFDASVTTRRSIGDANTIGGEWGEFDKVVDEGTPYGPWVVNDGSNPDAVNIGPAQSGTQSIGFTTLFPGGEDQGVQVFGRVSEGVPANENYELSFSIYQADFRASSMLTVGGDYVGAEPQPIDLRVFFEGGTQNIYLLYNNTGVPGQGFWIYTGIQMIEDTWMKVRVVADVNGTGEYNVFVTHEGEMEELAGEQPVPLHLNTREEIWQLDFSRQGDTGNTTYFDDFKLAYPSIPNDLQGDFNSDGSVDAADYTVWRDGLGTQYTQDDYNDWKANFGVHLGTGSASISVPEPTASEISLIGLSLLLTSAALRISRPPAGPKLAY